MLVAVCIYWILLSIFNIFQTYFNPKNPTFYNLSVSLLLTSMNINGNSGHIPAALSWLLKKGYISWRLPVQFEFWCEDIFPCSFVDSTFSFSCILLLLIYCLSKLIALAFKTFYKIHHLSRSNLENSSLQIKSYKIPYIFKGGLYSVKSRL